MERPKNSVFAVVIRQVMPHALYTDGKVVLRSKLTPHQLADAGKHTDSND